MHLYLPLVTDKTARLISRLQNLEMLQMYAPKMTDNALRHIAELEALKKLTLVHLDITDGALVHLQGLPKLEYLQVDKESIVASLPPPNALARMPGITEATCAARKSN